MYKYAALTSEKTIQNLFIYAATVKPETLPHCPASMKKKWQIKHYYLPLHTAHWKLSESNLYH